VNWALDTSCTASICCGLVAELSCPEPTSVQADVYIWRYALLVVHARKQKNHFSVASHAILYAQYGAKYFDEVFTLYSILLRCADTVFCSLSVQ